jgi:hypothetical protein
MQIMPTPTGGSIVTSDGKRNRVAGYSWTTGKAFFISERGKLLAETYLRTQNYAECTREMQKLGIKRGRPTIVRWMQKPEIKNYIREKLEERGILEAWTKERWMLVMTKHLRGEERLKPGDLYAMKLIGDVLGVSSPTVQLNQQINFTQADGTT